MCCDIFYVFLTEILVFTGIELVKFISCGANPTVTLRKTSGQLLAKEFSKPFEYIRLMTYKIIKQLASKNELCERFCLQNVTNILHDIKNSLGGDLAHTI